MARLRRCARHCLSVRSNRGRWAWRVITSGHNDAHISTRLRARIDLGWSSRHPIMHRYALESELTERGARRTRRAARRPTLEQIQRKSRVRERTPHNTPRIRAGVEKKDQKAELKKNQTRRRYVEKTTIFFQTTGRHPPGARRETTEVKTRKC